MATSVDTLVWLMQQQTGDRYIFGAEADLSDPDPSAFDCSELVQWACARCGVQPTMPDGSWIQWQHCRNHGTLISIEEAIRTKGALLFVFGSDPSGKNRPKSAHVAVSLGDGRTIEARGTRYGVGSWSVAGRGWTHAALIPGVDYSPGIKPASTSVIAQEDDVARVMVQPPAEHSLANSWWMSDGIFKMWVPDGNTFQQLVFLGAQAEKVVTPEGEVWRPFVLTAPHFDMLYPLVINDQDPLHVEYARHPRYGPRQTVVQNQTSDPVVARLAEGLNALAASLRK